MDGYCLARNTISQWQCLCSIEQDSQTNGIRWDVQPGRASLCLYHPVCRVLCKERPQGMRLPDLDHHFPLGWFFSIISSWSLKLAITCGNQVIAWFNEWDSERRWKETPTWPSLTLAGYSISYASTVSLMNASLGSHWFWIHSNYSSLRSKDCAVKCNQLLLGNYTWILPSTTFHRFSCGLANPTSVKLNATLQLLPAIVKTHCLAQLQILKIEWVHIDQLTSNIRMERQRAENESSTFQGWATTVNAGWPNPWLLTSLEFKQADHCSSEIELLSALTLRNTWAFCGCHC